MRLHSVCFFIELRPLSMYNIDRGNGQPRAMPIRAKRGKKTKNGGENK